MIEVEHISKSYDRMPVLKDVSLTILPGGISSIVGPNGAGKSTLLTIIGRLLQPDSGNVRVNGLDVAATPSDQLAKHLSILRQENHFVSRLTVRELVGFGRYPYSKGRLTPEDQREIDAALAFLDLSDLEHRFLDQLSGGQRQRAYVAMVFCQNTDYILLDEPLNNLDMKHAVAMMRQLRRAADELGKTVVLVIHDINFASVYSDQIIAMKNGDVVYNGTPAEIMNTLVLQDIFGTDVHVEEIKGRRIGIYY